ncbi:hypothetical protein DMJ13_00090 [halophilic archaeon]|nr:hypothetical protein DMJ13_00090 [halophilic archaeon]
MTSKSNQADAASLSVQDGNAREGYMFNNQFQPGSRFVVISEALPWNPENVGEGQLFTSFQTRMIQYTSAPNQFAFLFPYEDAQVQQGQQYVMGRDWEDVEDEQNGGDVGFSVDNENEQAAADFVNVAFLPAGAVQS